MLIPLEIEEVNKETESSSQAYCNAEPKQSDSAITGAAPDAENKAPLPQHRRQRPLLPRRAKDNKSYRASTATTERGHAVRGL
ncbi:unnamed protein product [Nippostrongylus brasiliensis]|uniref:Uncharacterized protein n=1 Tax=Nippostrongylus brasiliensis TaxID=27835 RepID=A0A0N4XX99_NIPBR|nr:unnamed protein product [Nippostrongylus brasiliensis]